MREKWLLIILLQLVSACSYLRWQDKGEEDLSPAAQASQASDLDLLDDPPEGAQQRKPAQAKDVSLQEKESALKQARIWARLDELEAMVLRQQEQLKLLEQGLTLGILPEELRKNSAAVPGLRPLAAKSQLAATRLSSPPSLLTQPQAASSEQSQSLGALGGGDAEEGSLPAKARAVYQERLAIARELFQQARYGKAYLEFSRLEREFSKHVSDGEAKYWIGRCWYQLKEYHNAKQYLSEFIEQYPGSSWLASAKFDLARVEWEMGLRENAVQRLQNLIKHHPYEGSAEAAKQLLQNMTKAL